MPSCKIFIEASKLVPDSVPAIFNEIIIEGLEAKGEHAITAVIESNYVKPSGCYIEITYCKKPALTHEILQKLAIRLDETARKVFQIEDPVRVRIFLFDEDFTSGTN
ncbi:hypothetical protein [Microbulbifer sp. GL-2]|uniref:hypothetical protein n=1 Tax=Microbulbifer sp. GL-2 TaxID=2591606 RepID=UPI0011650AB0|nr:hypothetical protein [Microbulbifer sp. GL-2]BBM01845.1 hypothetical protein GL2_19190 [Microbulbifer sp. GL-2]